MPSHPRLASLGAHASSGTFLFITSPNVSVEMRDLPNSCWLRKYVIISIFLSKWLQDSWLKSRSGQDSLPASFYHCMLFNYWRGPHLWSPGAFIPRCNEEGYYKATQCHGSTGQCWCVDKYGNEIAGSRKQGTVNCGKLWHASLIEINMVWTFDCCFKTWGWEYRNHRRNMASTFMRQISS